MADGTEVAGGHTRPLLWPGYFVGGVGLTVASIAVASVLGPIVSDWSVPLAASLFYGVVLLAPFAKAAQLVGRRFVFGTRCPWFAFALGVAAPWLLIGGVLLAPSALDYMGRKEFDAAAWRRARVTGDHERIRMVDDLIDSGKLDGLSRDDVEALLGPDEQGSGFFAEWDAVYWLGPERSLFSIDSEWLVIRYGGDGLVQTYRTVRD